MEKIIIAYDISCPRRLYRIAKIMKGYGTRVQNSIFEADLTTRQYKKLLSSVEPVIEKGKDGVKFLPICDDCKGKEEKIGVTVKPEEEKFFYIY